MRKNILLKILIFFLIFANTEVIGQDILWRKSSQGITGDFKPFKSMVDGNDNIYVIAWFKGTIQVGSNTYTVNTANYNGLIAKYDKNGNFQWSRNIGGYNKDDYTVGIDISNDNSKVYVLAEIVDSLKIDGTFYNVKTDGNYDTYIVEFNATNGNVNNTQRICYGGANTVQRGSALKVDINGDLIVSGYTNATSITVVDSTLSLTGTLNCLLYKFGSNLSRKPGWPKKYTTTNVQNRFFTLDITPDAYYISGAYIGSMTLDVATLTTSGTTGIFLYKTNLNGIGKWVRKIKGNGTDFSNSCAYDGDRSVYLSGYTNSSYLKVDSASGVTDTSRISFPAKGNNDVIYARYDTSGTLQWYNRIGSTGDDRLTRVYANSNYVQIAGQFAGTIDFGQPVTTKGGLDALGLIYDKYNNLIHVLNAGGTGNDVGETGFIDSEGNYIFIGDFLSPKLYIVNDSSLTNATTATKDMFMVKFDKMILSAVLTNPTCAGSTNGSINLTVQGSGVQPYTYLWSNAATTEDLNNVGAGQYIVTVTDAMTHSVKDTFTLTAPPVLTCNATVLTNVSCKYDNTGSAQITASGGTGTKTYNINGGTYQASNTFTGLTAGNYTLGVKDANGCTCTSLVTVTEPAQALTANATSNPISGPGNTDGSITITATGGTVSYQYKLNSGSWQSSNYFLNLGAGNYTYTVRDANSCTFSDVIAVGIFSLVFSKTDVTCNGLSDGTATATPNGGLAPYSYLWSSGSTTQTASGLAAGAVTVRVIDSNNDTVNSGITINQPATLSSIISPTNVSCAGGSNGSINLSVSGGTLPYRFAWTRNGSSIPNKTKDLADLTAGNYGVTITDTNNCNATNSTTITELSFITVSLTPTDQTCYQGTNDGIITSSVSGAYGVVSYLWNNGKTTSSINKLVPDSYSLTVTDAANCTASANQVINPGLQILGSIDKQDITCNGLIDGQATMNPSFQGGRSLGSYLWNNPSHSTTAAITGLSKGNYTVIVKDNLNCEQSFSTTINEPAALNLTENLANHQNVTCHGGNNGQLGVTATGGTGTYEYQLNGGAWVTSEIFNSLTAGNYTVVFRDFNHPACQYSGLGPIIIAQPGQLNVNLSADPGNNICTGTSVTFTTTPTGLSGYDFQIGGISVQNDTSHTFTTSALVTGNIITVTVDSSGCTKTSTGILMSVNALPTVTMNGTTSICSGDSATLSVTLTGTAPWNVVYSDGSTTDTINNIPSTPYTFKVGPVVNTTYSITQVSDANCSGTDFGNSADVTISLPPAISSQPSNSTVCISVGTAFGIGATGDGLTFQWQYSSNGGSSWDDMPDGGVYSGMTTDTMSISGATLIMSSGEYRCVVSGTCLPADTSDPATLTVNPNPTALASLIQQESCTGVANGIAKVVASGGTAPYTYSWNSLPVQTNDTAFNLASGDYVASVTDANSCGPAISNVTITDLPSLGLSEVITHHTDVTCNGGQDGSFEVLASGGSAIYEYEINGSGGWTRDSIFKNIIAGSYKVIVRDSGIATCTYSGLDSIIITEPLLLTLSTPVVTDASSQSATDGTISATGSGGNGQLTYILYPGGSKNITGSFTVGTGNYVIAVTDAHNCDTVRSDTTYVGYYTGIGPNPTLYNLKVIPNPSDGKLKIEFDDPKSNGIVVEVYNIKGQKVLMKVFPVRTAGIYREDIDLSASPKGLYFTRINNITFKDAIIIK